MGCGCGKKTPVGVRKGAAVIASRKADEPKEAVSTRPKKASGTTQQFALERVDGRTQFFGSRLEAEAAKVRAGGGTVRRVR